MQGTLPSNTSTVTLYSHLSVSFYMGIVKISSTISFLTTNKSKTMQTLTCAQMRLAEEDAVSRGISLLTLMENAGERGSRNFVPTPQSTIRLNALWKRQ